jgi:hypothetical protein
MSKSGLTNTLQESLMLQEQFSALYTRYWDEKDDKVKEGLMRSIVQIRKRMYKLPNYNMSGLEKIMKFMKRAQVQEGASIA